MGKERKEKWKCNEGMRAKIDREKWVDNIG